MPNEKELQSRCRNLLTEYGDLLNFIVSNIEIENKILPTNLDSAFKYAKAYIERESRKQGARRVVSEINKYANKN